MSPAKAAPAVRFEATLYTIDGSTILRLPEKASNQLPPRGQVAVRATVNGHAGQTVAEPDGESGHWVRIDAKQQRAAALRAGATAEVELVPLEDWPEPQVPHDLQAASPQRWTRSRNCGRTSRRWRAGRGSVGECDPESRHAPAPRRSQHLEDTEREAPTVLFQPGRVHRPGPFEEREADQSAMIHLAHATSEPWGVSPRMTPRTSSPRQDPAASRAIDAIIKAPGDWRSTTLARLRAVILSADASIVEEVKWKKPSRPMGVPVWSRDGNICIGEALKSAVRLTFPKGALLKDPKHVFNTRLDSATVRAVDFREGDMVSEAALRALIGQAVELNTSKARTR